ncbi:golgi-body localization protein domain-containing protein [Boletus edulis]|nr:golgi-body localization protein domain-containing protein [Boletus edulis]
MPSVELRWRLLLASLALSLALLLQWPTSTSSWILLACWPLGALFFSYTARAYLAPYVLMRFSSHIRVRSVSLRSIRGLYFRKGTRTWRIDRFVYSYRSSADDGPRRLSFRIEGFTLEIEPPPAPRPLPPRPTHRRGLTLADLSPSPLALYLWSVISGLYVVFDPAVRPVLRLVVTATLQQIIRFIPRLTETIQVDIDRAVVSYVGFPQIQFIVQNVTLKGHVSFAQSPQLRPVRDYVPSSSQALSARALAMGAWKSRLSTGFQRAWTRTWNDTLGQMTGSISYDLAVQQVHGFIPSGGLVQMGISDSGTVLRSQEPSLVSGSARFSPRDGSVEPCSIHNQVKVGAIYMDADNLQRWLSHFNMATRNVPAPPPSSLSTAASPWLKSPFSASSVTSDLRVQVRAKRRKQNVKPLEFVAAVRLDLDSVTVSQKIGCHRYNIVLKTVTCSCEPSNATVNLAHRAWLGKGLPTMLRAFLFHFKVHGVSVHRPSGVSQSNPPILSVDSTSVDATLSDWPSMLSADSWTCDASPPSLLLEVQIVSVSFADRHEMLLNLISELNSPNNIPRGESESLLPTVVSPVPRVAMNVRVGRTFARVMCADVPGVEEPFSVELETEGMVLTSSSDFRIGSVLTQRLPPDGDLPFRMTCPFTFFLYPIFFRLRSHSSNVAPRRMSTWDSDCTSSETLLSMEAVEANGTLTGLGEANDDDQFVYATLDTRTMFVDIHCCTEAAMVELWHPGRLRILSVLLSLLSAHWPSSQARPPRSSSTSTPGCALSFSVARFVLFVTGSDVNPDADKEITRGIAFSTGFSLRYCSINMEQIHALPPSQPYSQTRAKLSLPVDNSGDAALLEKISETSGANVIVGKLILWNTTVRAATADEFSMDDPHITERDSPLLDTKQLLSIKGVNVDVKFTPKVPMNSAPAAWDLTFSVDDALTRFELGLIYSTLLALRTIQTLQQSVTVQGFPPHPAPSTILNVQGTVKTIRMRLQLMDESTVARVNYLDVTLAPHGTRCSVDSLLVWVPVPGGTWEELARLHRCTLSLAPSLKGPIFAESDSIRVRIPSGYVFAELQLAAVVTLKATKHLVHVVQSARFSPMPAPEAESAKLVPDLTFTCRMLCFEAADDPFESQLGFNLRVGLAAAKARLHREEAFNAKAMAVMSGNLAAGETSVVNTDYQFGGEHSVSIEDARQRLNLAHSLDWTTRHRQHIRERVTQEELVHRELHGAIPLKRPTKVPDLVNATKPLRIPPLLRIILSDFHLHLQRPAFPPEHLVSFLHDQGSGIPHETCYSLLIPMHLSISLTAVQVSLRDYPLPLLYIPSRSGDHGSASLVFDSNLVIAEEMGPPQSVDWISCPLHGLEDGFAHIHPVVIRVPKTLMPVKTYARPLISVLTNQTTAFAWGVSYSSAIQDVVRVLDSLTPETRDPSPHIGFWDKLRLIFHWTTEISFKEEVRLYIKGERDPYILDKDGAGFALCWQGEPRISIGSRNRDRELVQVTSDSMSILIPKFEPATSSGSIYAQGHIVARNDWVKMCANLRSGIRFGVGAMFERTCNMSECSKCTGSPFDRGCRSFHFLPHYTIKLAKIDPSGLQVNHDSYHGFRSNFIHLSISITSALRHGLTHSSSQPSSFHLTPKAFASFWSWWGLFDSGLSLPIRQGSLYHRKSLSPKFARHLATVKYRISVPELFITHAYIDDTRESWEDGTTTMVGLKAKVSHFQADMHQRDQETIAPGKVADSIQVVRHKPFYAAEVVLKDVDLRAMLAVFLEPLKQSVLLSAIADNKNEGQASSSSRIPSSWLDSNDFVETDWSSPHNLPEIQLSSVLSCPKVTYLKKNSHVTEIQAENSKFGDEDTHTCLLGSEPSVPQVEIFLAEQRVVTLQQMIEEEAKAARPVQRQYPLGKMITLLREYTSHLQTVDQCPEGVRKSNAKSYYMPAEMVSANEWADFENVYQVHSPNLFMCDAVRDLLMRYYNCSKARRGYEYHMATRAVKFIRDQAEAMLPQVAGHNSTEKSNASAGAAQTAASALRKMLAGGRGSTSLDIRTDVVSDPADVKPLDGWDEGVVLRKRHFCLLLKPQIILRSIDPSLNVDTESVAILAAVQAKLQVFKIMDASNLEDPISGPIMHRNYTSLDGLQTFCPTDSDSYDSGSVPLEVLLDYRCESDSFDRIVPQTNANCQYDRFNRLRLRNNVASTAYPKSEHTHRGRQAHLQNDTDLVLVHVPRFTVSANDRHFQFISDIITHLVLFSDVAHKARLERLETLLFAYDFTDLRSAASVVSDLQSRLRSALETHDDISRQMQNNRPQKTLQILKLKAHIFLLVEELNLIFDAIRLAQSRTDGHSDNKSALLLQASSSEISWRMLDDNRDLLAKLAVRNIDFSWLSKQDSSTVNRLTLGNLQAFDGSPNAIWTEIVSKFEELSSHPLCKRDIFLDADWAVLAPVGGITIYEKFQLEFHPIRLQLDARLGQRIMEYVWPARRGRNQADTHSTIHDLAEPHCPPEQPPSRASLESALLLQKPRASLESNRLTPNLRKLGSSRSFTDLRSAAAESAKTPIEASFGRVATPDLNVNEDSRSIRKVNGEDRPGKDDAVEMKTRSSQKTFILVKISSIELLLSMIKAESFECRDARIRTHALEFRNQTWSFEELVDQFLPSDLTWRGWVRMAFHQPLVPVFPVARELFSKTKFIPSKNASQNDSRPSSKKLTLRGKKNVADSTIRDSSPRRSSSSGGAPSAFALGNSLTGTTLVNEPEATGVGPLDLGGKRQHSRPRLLSVFVRGKNATRSALLSSQAEHSSSGDFLPNTRDSTVHDELINDH